MRIQCDIKQYDLIKLCIFIFYYLQFKEVLKFEILIALKHNLNNNSETFGTQSYRTVRCDNTNHPKPKTQSIIAKVSPDQRVISGDQG